MTETVVLERPDPETLAPMQPQVVDEGIGHADGTIDPARVRLFRGPNGVLRATIAGDRSLLRARVAWAFPLTDDGRYLSVLDSKNKEACLIEDPTRLDAESRRLIAEELARYYRVSTITRILSFRQEFRVMYWHVATDRGERDFVVKWNSDTVLWLGANTVQFEDVDGNRFVIPDVRDLDKRSRKIMALLQ